MQYNEYDNAYYLGNADNRYLYLIQAKNLQITSCNVNSNCKYICSYAFENCELLVNITIPNSIEAIGDSAFRNCSLLQYNTYDNAYYIGNDDNPNLVLIKAKNTSITSCNIDCNCRFIYRGAFMDCSLLVNIDISNNVLSIGLDAFYNCSSLQNIIIGNSITIIEQGVFTGCQSLDKVYFLGNKNDWDSIQIYNYNKINSNIVNATKYYYSEIEPFDTNEKYWHYDSDGTTILEW